MTMPQRPRRRPKSTQQPYHWFHGESVRALYDRLGAAGPDSARLEVHQDGDSMTFRVVADGEGDETGKAEESDINNSFICPPRCP